MAHTEELVISSSPASRGIDWLIDSFGLFAKSWLAWIGVILTLFFLMIFANFIPFLGSLALQILFPVFTGGLMLGCRAADKGDGFTFSHLFDGFSNNFGSLMVVGVIHLAGTLLIMLISFICLMLMIGDIQAFMETMQSLQVAMENEDMNQIMDITSRFVQLVLLFVLVYLALYLPLLMLMWFAPALVVLEDAEVFDALKGSFIGCARNVVPYLLYGIVGLILSIFATLPLGLGWLVLTPMIFISIYLAYRDIYKQGSE